MDEGFYYSRKQKISITSGRQTALGSFFPHRIRQNCLWLGSFNEMKDFFPRRWSLFDTDVSVPNHYCQHFFFIVLPVCGTYSCQKVAGIMRPCVLHESCRSFQMICSIVLVIYFATQVGSGSSFLQNEPMSMPGLDSMAIIPSLSCHLLAFRCLFCNC